MKKIFIFLTLAGFLIIFPVLAAAADSNTAISSITTSLTNTATQAQINDLVTDNNIYTFIGNLLGDLFKIIGIIFLLLVIYAGFLWMTAGGNSDKVEQGKKIMSWAVLGVVVISLAYAITTFVFDLLK